MTNLTPKPIIDKNGVATTRNVNPNKGTAAAPTRKLPSAAASKAVPKARPAGSVGGYEIKSYKSIQGRETANFNAKIYKDGKHVLNVSNDGNGGSNRYEPVALKKRTENWSKTVSDFHAFAREFEGNEPTDGYSEDGDSLIEFMRWMSSVEKHADKIGRPREEVLAFNIDAENERYRTDGLTYLIISDKARANMIAAAAVQ